MCSGQRVSSPRCHGAHGPTDTSQALSTKISAPRLPRRGLDKGRASACPHPAPDRGGSLGEMELRLPGGIAASPGRAVLGSTRSLPRMGGGQGFQGNIWGWRRRRKEIILSARVAGHGAGRPKPSSPWEEGASPPGWLKVSAWPSCAVLLHHQKKGRGAGRHPASTAPSRLHPAEPPKKDTTSG